MGVDILEGRLEEVGGVEFSTLGNGMVIEDESLGWLYNGTRGVVSLGEHPKGQE